MEPQRFVLSAAQMSEAFAAANCVPKVGDFPDGLPAACGILPDALAGADGALDPALRRILETIARPQVSLRVARSNGGGTDTAESVILRIQNNSYVVLAKFGPEDWQLSLLENRAAMMALIEGFVGQAGESFPGEAPSMASPRALPAASDDAASGICGRCGTLYGDAPVFCRECGDSLRAPGEVSKMPD